MKLDCCLKCKMPKMKFGLDRCFCSDEVLASKRSLAGILSPYSGCSPRGWFDLSSDCRVREGDFWRGECGKSMWYEVTPNLIGLQNGQVHSNWTSLGLSEYPMTIVRYVPPSYYEVHTPAQLCAECFAELEGNYPFSVCVGCGLSAEDIGYIFSDWAEDEA